MAKDVLKYNEDKTSVIGINVPKKDLKEVVIPAGVKTIGKETFKECKGLQRVVLPKGLKTIEESAFYGCENLKDMDIPDSVRDIGNSALRGCRSLTKIQIPSKIKSIGEWAFCGCGFVELTIPETIKVIKKGMLASLFDIHKLNLPNTIREIEPRGLAGLSHLIGIPHIPEGVKKMGARAMSYGSFGIVELPASLEEIDIRLFYECTNLKEIRIASESNYFAVINNALCSKDRKILYHYPYAIKDTRYEIPEGVEVIKEAVFMDNMYLETVKFPSSLRVIESVAFLRCQYLKQLEFPEGLTTICTEAFEKCTRIESITLPASLKTIEKDAFLWCTGVKTIISLAEEPVDLVRDALFKYTRVSENTIQAGPGNGKGTTYPIIHVPVGCKSKYKKAKGWKSFEIIDDVVDGKIDSNITKERIEETAQKQQKKKVCRPNIVIKDGTEEIRRNAYKEKQEIESVEMPDSVTLIREGAFRGCKSLKSIKFSSNLDQIDVCAFSGCESLSEIVFPKKITLIGEWAFRSCSSLTTVEIPLSSTDLKIRYGAFENCDNLQKIILKRYSPDKIKVFSESFSDKVMNSCTLVVPEESIEAYKKHEVFGKFKNIIAL